MNDACIIAHPAHELRVFHWLERTSPTVFILTDGSGGQSSPRVAMSRALVEENGGRVGSVFGAMTDRDAYAMIMTRDTQGLERLLGELAHGVAAVAPRTIAGDACEGYNPVHDLCRVLVNATCALLGITDAERNLAFRLTGVPEPQTHDLVFELDEAALARKLAWAHRYTAVDDEVRAALAEADGAAPFRYEVLTPQPTQSTPTFDGPPYYEQFGRERVRLGVYREALTYDHFRSACDVIDTYVAKHT